MRWISFITSGYFIQIKNTLSSQVHMEHSPWKTTSWVTNQTAVNLNKSKIVSSIFSDHNAMRLISTTRGKKKNCQKHKHMEIRQ